MPFQGHTANGLRTGVAAFLGMPREKVRVVYVDGPQVYGRTAADDAGFEAAWDTKGPPYLFKLRGGLDAAGKLVALDCDACAADHNHLGYNEPDTVLITQLMGRRPKQPAKGSAEAPTAMYGIPNRRTTTRIVTLPLVWETPLRTDNLRHPNGPQVTFAFEAFVDEMAAAAKTDPVQFRLDLIEAGTEDKSFRKIRSLATVRAAAKAYGWESRPSPQTSAAGRRGQLLTGRGIAYTIRSNTIAAVIAKVEVDRETGQVWAKRLVCAHDCGLVINRDGLRHTVKCGLLHGLSRALWEEVQFDEQKVTSVDWFSHPSLRHSDTPEHIDIVLVNGDPNPDRPDLAPYGAGETSQKPVIAALANAIYDATGVRIRRAPFRSERVLAALKTTTVRGWAAPRRGRGPVRCGASPARTTGSFGCFFAANPMYLYCGGLLVATSATVRWKRLRERLLDLPRRLALPFMPAEEQDRVRGEWRAEAFGRIAREQRWGEVLSGTGSPLDATVYARRIITQEIRDYRITSLLDIPCGDFGWMPRVLSDSDPGLRDIGYDIVPELVGRNARARSQHDFRVIDFVRDELPVTDLSLCRDVLQHLPVAAIRQALRNISRSGCGYLLATTHLRRTGYRNSQPCRPGSCRERNLMLPPFDLPDPLVIFSERSDSKFLGLWQLPFA